MPVWINRRTAVAGLVASVAAPGIAVAADPIKVAAITKTVFYMPLWVAMHRGFFKDNGLDVDVTFLDNAGQTDDMLRKGEMQFVLRSPEQAMIDGYRGGALRIIAGGVSRLPHFIIAQPGIKSVEQLRGANIGVLAAKEGTTYVVRDIAKSAGLKDEDYKISIVGGSPTRWKLLQEGKIDAGLQPIPNSYVAEAAGFSNLGSATKFVPDWQFTCVNVDNRWAESHRDVVVRFLRGLQLGRDYMRNNPPEAAKIGAEELNVTQALALRMLEDVETYDMMDHETEVNVAGLQKVFDTLKVAAEIPADWKFDPTVFVDFSYWSESHNDAEPSYTASIRKSQERQR